MSEHAITLDDKSVPWWIKFAYSFGISALLAVGLVWFNSIKLYTSVVSIEEQIKLNRADIGYIIKANEEHSRRLNSVHLMLQRICVRVSENAAERNDCFSELPPRRDAPQ